MRKIIEQAALQHHLTLREAEILHLLFTGQSSKSVARRLAISHRTVDKHRQNIFAKLGVASLRSAIGRLGSLYAKSGI